MHRYLWEKVNGTIPPKMFVDHRNGNKLDNRLDNLKLTTKRGNSQNLRCHREGTTSSKYPCVSKAPTPSKWHSRIWYEGKLHRLGTFNSEEAAYQAYVIAQEERRQVNG